jgi:recombination protein RecA
MSKLAALAAAIGETPKVDSALGVAKVDTKNVKILSKADALDQIKALEKTLNKQFDTTGSIMLLGNRVGVDIPVISTNLPSLDNEVLQAGGLPRGRIIEIYGPESCGKTTFCLHMIACEQQNNDTLCAFVDAEHALDVTYAAKLGVNVKELLISQPDSGEQALETVEALIDGGLVSLIVVDSVSALVPQAELDGEMGDSHIGLQARLMSQAMRKLRGKANEKGITLIFINQIREKVGVMFGSPEVTSGGRALKFYASVRLDIRRRTLIGDKEQPIGHDMEIKATKNKVGSPYRSTTVKLIYGVGIDTWTDFVDYAAKVGALDKSEKGGYYSFNGEKIAQGLTNVIEAVKLDSTLKAAISNRLTEIRKETK